MKSIDNEKEFDSDNFKNTFKLIDEDGSGSIDKKEMTKFVAQLKAM